MNIALHSDEIVHFIASTHFRADHKQGFIFDGVRKFHRFQVTPKALVVS